MKSESTFKFGEVEVTYLKHAGFQIKGTEDVIYIDPYDIARTDLEKADIILVTHDHFDHLDTRSIKNLSKPDTVVVFPRGCYIEGYQTCEVLEGERIVVKGVEIEAVPAYNIGKPFHKEGCVGYIVEVDGVRIYHAGDTDRIPEMRGVRVDIALLPIGGTYTMDVEEAKQAAADINAKYYIPMHYGAIPDTDANPEDFDVPGAVILKPLIP
jgi:L-ascorbate metabolism protein UlaG (beta-lactamase superfamily)